MDGSCSRAAVPKDMSRLPIGSANAGLSGGFQLAACDGAPDVLRMEAVEDVTAESRSLAEVQLQR